MMMLTMMMMMMMMMMMIRPCVPLCGTERAVCPPPWSPPRQYSPAWLSSTSSSTTPEVETSCNLSIYNVTSDYFQTMQVGNVQLEECGRKELTTLRSADISLYTTEASFTTSDWLRLISVSTQCEIIFRSPDELLDLSVYIYTTGQTGVSVS